jgi:hypothetical protein
MKCEKCSNDIINKDYPVCMKCGFLKSKALANTPEAEQLFSQSPLFIKDIHVVDNDGYIWIPTSLYLERVGAIYSMFSTENELHPYGWHVAKIAAIPLLERIKYPIPGKIDEYYETRLDVETAIAFKWNEFEEALRLFESYMIE